MNRAGTRSRIDACGTASSIHMTCGQAATALAINISTFQPFLVRTCSLQPLWRPGWHAAQSAHTPTVIQYCSLHLYPKRMNLLINLLKILSVQCSRYFSSTVAVTTSYKASKLKATKLRWSREEKGKIRKRKEWRRKKNQLTCSINRRVSNVRDTVCVCWTSGRSLSSTKKMGR